MTPDEVQNEIDDYKRKREERRNAACGGNARVARARGSAFLGAGERARRSLVQMRDSLLGEIRRQVEKRNSKRKGGAK
jgi:hypothetical protein